MGFIKKSFVATEFCGLCRGRFPSSSLYGLDAWQSEFRAVLLLEPNNEDSVEITDVASLPDTYHDIDATLTGRPTVEPVTICRDLRTNVERPAVGPAFCFHGWCYSILIWRLRCPPKLIIYKLIRSLIPNYSLWENICEALYQLDPGGSLQTLVAHADRSSLELQSLSMSKLPPEVRTRIWKYVGLSTPYSAFLLVAGESSRLARYVESHSTHDLALERGSLLSAKTIMVFGTEYIRDLGHGDGYKVTSNVLGNVTGVKFVASVGGICAIKLLGSDWETGWLGKVPGTGHVWYGTIHAFVPRLRCAYNDLNCVNISSLRPSTRDIFLWDQPDITPSLVDPDAMLFDFSRDILGAGRGNMTPKRRFFRYLPLYSSDEYTRGLTVYFTGHGIVGIEAHFTRSSQLSGCRQGCSLYFPLYLEERIAHTWLRIINSSSLAFAAPALTIQTTLGRIYTFGSYIWPHLVMENEYKWILLKTKGYVTGFYYENLTSGTTIMRLGVTSDGISGTATPRAPQYHACDIPLPPIAGPNAGLFLSVAVLHDLEKIDLCRTSTRCTGVLIHYVDGRSVALGQWRNLDVSQHSCIYNNSTTSTLNLYFKMARSGSHKIVTDIRFSEHTSEAVPDAEYQVFGMGTHIAWWFSELHDVVLPWTGDFQDVPVESQTSQEQLIP